MQAVHLVALTHDWQFAGQADEARGRRTHTTGNINTQNTTNHHTKHNKAIQTCEKEEAPEKNVVAGTACPETARKLASGPITMANDTS